MSLNLMLRSLNVADFLCVTLIVKATQVSDLFQCQIKYAFVRAKLFIIDVYNIFDNKIAKLHGSRTKQPQILNYDKCQKRTYMYMMCFPAQLPVSKNLKTFSVYRRHVRQIS